MSELNITLEHQPNNNRFDEDQGTTGTSRHPITFNPKLRPAISSGSVHKASFQVQDDMVLLNNATRSSLFTQTISGARSVNDLDQLPTSGGGHQSTLPAYRAAPDYETAMRNKFRTQPKFITDLVQPFTLEQANDQAPNLTAVGAATQHTHPASSIYSTSTPELNRINLTYHHHPHPHPSVPTQTVRFLLIISRGL